MDRKQKSKYVLLGLNTQHFRKLQGYTQEALAEKIDMETVSIGKIENARVGASLDTIFKIADALEVDTYRLFYHYGQYEEGQK